MKFEFKEKLKQKLLSFNYKQFLIKTLLSVAVMGMFFIPIYYSFNAVDTGLWEALKSGDANAMLDEIEKYDNIYGILIVAILQIVQDVVIIIPSAPVHLVAGMVLGTWKGFLVCHLADVFANMLIFFIYSRIKKFIDKFMPIDESNKTVQMIKQGKSSTYMVVMVCLLPAVPNGFIPYAAVNAGMKLGKYTLAVTIGCAVPTIVMTALGHQLADMNWILMTFLIAISFVGVFFLLKYQHHVLKMIEKAKHNTVMFITEEIPEHEIDDKIREESKGRAPRRFRFTNRVVYAPELKYQDIPTSDVANPFAAFFSFKQTPIAKAEAEAKVKGEAEELHTEEENAATEEKLPETVGAAMVSDESKDEVK